MALKMHPSIAPHVGEWLRTEIVEPHGVLINDLVVAFGVSRQAISALLNGRARLSAEMAIRFEMAFGVKADTLMRMQVAHDMAQARQSIGKLHVKRMIAA